MPRADRGKDPRAKPPARVKLPLIRHKGGPKLRITSETIARAEEDEDLYRYKRSLG